MHLAQATDDWWGYVNAIMRGRTSFSKDLGAFNPLNAELNTICHLLALSGARHIPHISGIRVTFLGARRLT